MLKVGHPEQTLEVDVDLLSPDFYTVVTTSGMGVGYNASASESHGTEQYRTITNRDADIDSRI